MTAPGWYKGVSSLHYNVGPFRRSNGNFYTFLRSKTDADNVGIWRSTDGGTNWTLIQTITSPISGTDSVRTMHARQDPSSLDVVDVVWTYIDASPTLAYLRWSMATESVVTAAAVADTGTSSESKGADIISRANGERVAAWASNALPSAPEIGWRSTGGTWSWQAPTFGISDPGTPNLEIDLGSGNVHSFWWTFINSGTRGMVHRVFRSDNTLATEQVVVTNGSMNAPIQPSGRRSILIGTRLYALFVITTSDISLYYSDALGETPTWAVLTNVTAGTAIDVGGDRGAAGLVTEGGRAFFVYVRESDQQIRYREIIAGGPPTLGTDTQLGSLTTVEDAQTNLDAAFVTGGNVHIGGFAGATLDFDTDALIKTASVGLAVVPRPLLPWVSLQAVNRAASW